VAWGVDVTGAAGFFLHFFFFLATAADFLPFLHFLAACAGGSERGCAPAAEALAARSPSASSVTSALLSDLSNQRESMRAR
jgi:hypothetical protein